MHRVVLRRGPEKSGIYFVLLSMADRENSCGRVSVLDSAVGWLGVTDVNGSAPAAECEALPLSGLGATSSSAKRPKSPRQPNGDIDRICGGYV
jgi:hypothetical protein